MRKSNLLFSAFMTLAVGLLAGCSDDHAPDTPGIETVDHDQVRYLNVAIVSPKTVETRAASFDAGTSDENTIYSMTFAFYDANGLPAGQIKTLTDEEIGRGQITDGSGGSIGRIWKSTIPVALHQGENLPSYVLCFVNPMDVSGLAGKSLKEIETITRGEVVQTDEERGKLFPMSNSMYYGTSPQGLTDVRLYATPISTNQLYPSEDAAGRDMNVVDIYVERYASRMKLTMLPSAVEDNTTSVNGYKLTFVPEFWRPNAIDQNIYIIKRYGIVEGDNKNFDPTYAQLLNNFGDRTWWNDAPNFRSYWGCSPSYYTDKYPSVSDDITDFAPDNDYGAGRTSYPFDQHYFNYNQIQSSTISGGNPLQESIAWDTDTGFDKVFYARETTSAARTWGYNNNLGGYNPLTVLPSVVIVGHYQLEKTGGDKYTDVPEGRPSFYLYGRTDNKYNLYFESGIIGAMVKQQNVVLQKKAEGVYSAYRNTAYFKVEHPSKEVREIKRTVVAGRHVALQLKSESLSAELYYYDATQDVNNRYVRITAENINKVNSDLLSAGYATKYGEGIAYFNIPVEHLGIYDDAGNYLPDVKDGNNSNKYNFSKCPPGSFGIVRNHTYTIDVTKISGLGTALRDKTQPIVPPVEEVSYEISARLNILAWRIIPTQQVEL